MEQVRGIIREERFWSQAGWALALGSVLLVVWGAFSNVSAWQPASRDVVAGKGFLVLDAEALTESSGLAFSNVDQECVWSHNDSGGKARLFAFDEDGRHCGRTSIRGIKANDWEDMASFVDDVPRLLVADVGDNSANRESVTLYLFDEPDPRSRTIVESYQRLQVTYRDGPENCESVAVDLENRRILLLGKSALVSRMHEVPLPDREKPSKKKAKASTIKLQARPIRTVAIPMATGMDLCVDSGDLWITSYLSAYQYHCEKGQSLEERLRQVPKMVDLPKLRQVEALAIDSRGRVWVTSEGRPAKLQRVLTAQ